MRSRNIKPGFFLNDQLAELDFQTRLLYIGLWCYADREGRFDWNPKRIKAAVFPYDDVDVEPMLMSLHVMTFLDKYRHCNCMYGVVKKFHSHQHPHPHEPKSKIPSPEEGEILKNGEFVEKTDVITCHVNDITCVDNVNRCQEDIRILGLRKEDIRKEYIGNGGVGEKPDSPIPDADAPGTTPLPVSDSKISIPKTPKPKPIPIPADFSISDRVLDWSRREGYTHLPQYLEVLLNWVQNRKNEGKEPKYLDWDLVLMRCVREDWGKVKEKIAAQPVTRRYLSDTSADWAAVYQSEGKYDNT